MDKIGIVICNYNKCNYILKCVQSIFEQSKKEIDIYVVDNASSDDSVKQLKDNFGESITIIENKENLGGSGGFNTGLRAAMKKNYPYIMLIDNDTILDKNTVEILYHFLEEHKEVGIAGCKILMMDNPNIIQEFGAKADFDKMIQKANFHGEADNEKLPSYVYCDYVAACGLMVKREVIQQVGLMPEDNFIYWDDVEWGIRVNKAGYKVAAVNNAKIWHKGGANTVTNTFGVYYSYRNKFRFFAKYCDYIDIEKICDKLLYELFQALTACYISNKKNRTQTIMDAFLDAICNITGKAKDYQIRPIDNAENKFIEYIKDLDEILIDVNGHWENTKQVLNYFHNKNCKIKVLHLPSENIKEFYEKYPDYSLGDKKDWGKLKNCIKICEHIFNIKEDLLEKNVVYVDGWKNIVIDETDFSLCKQFKNNYCFFSLCYKERIMNWIKTFHK